MKYLLCIGIFSFRLTEIGMVAMQNISINLSMTDKINKEAVNKINV